MKQLIKDQHLWRLILVGSVIPLTIILGNRFQLSQQVIILIVLVAALVFGAMAMWMRANADATGEEWWQDDSSSGWRGY